MGNSRIVEVEMSLDQSGRGEGQPLRNFSVLYVRITDSIAYLLKADVLEAVCWQISANIPMRVLRYSPDLKISKKRNGVVPVFST